MNLKIILHFFVEYYKMFGYGENYPPEFWFFLQIFLGKGIEL